MLLLIAWNSPFFVERGYWKFTSMFVLKIERRTVMDAFETEVVINGPQEKVFDVVTTTGHWPHWAHLSRAVAGVTERPFQLGDRIYEFVRTPTGPQEVLWQITEYDPPRPAKLVAEDRTSF